MDAFLALHLLNEIMILVRMFICIVIALTLFVMHANSTSNRIFIVLFVAVALDSLYYYLAERIPGGDLFPVSDPGQFLFGPLVLSGMSYWLGRPVRKPLQYTFYLVPAVLFALKLLHWVNPQGFAFIHAADWGKWSMLYNFPFFVITILWVLSYEKKFKPILQLNEQFKLSWVINTVLAGLIIYTCFIVYYLLDYFLISKVIEQFPIAWLSNPASIFLLLYFGKKVIYQRDLFLHLDKIVHSYFDDNPGALLPVDEARTADTSLHQGSERYKSARLSDEKREQIYRTLVGLFENEGVDYREEITLAKLANRLKIPAAYLSQAINITGDQHFYTLVNYYRIKKFVDLLHHPDYEHFSIWGLAMKCGFRSKASFNNAFKQYHDGLTPGEYRMKILKEKTPES